MHSTLTISFITVTFLPWLLPRVSSKPYVCQRSRVHSSDSTRAISPSRITISGPIHILLAERNEENLVLNAKEARRPPNLPQVYCPCEEFSLSAAGAASWPITWSTCLSWSTRAPVIYRPPWTGKACWSLGDFTDSVSSHYFKATPFNLIFREENDCFSFVLLRQVLLTRVIKL